MDGPGVWATDDWYLFPGIVYPCGTARSKHILPSSGSRYIERRMEGPGVEVNTITDVGFVLFRHDAPHHTLPPFAAPTPAPAPAAAAAPRGSKPGGNRDRFLASTPKIVDTRPSTRGPSNTTTPTT